MNVLLQKRQRNRVVWYAHRLLPICKWFANIEAQSIHFSISLGSKNPRALIPHRTKRAQCTHTISISYQDITVRCGIVSPTRNTFFCQCRVEDAHIKCSSCEFFSSLKWTAKGGSCTTAKYRETIFNNKCDKIAWPNSCGRAKIALAQCIHNGEANDSKIFF